MDSEIAQLLILMNNNKIFYILFGAALLLLLITLAYMRLNHIPLGSMPVLVWVLFALAMVFPLYKGVSRGRKK